MIHDFLTYGPLLILVVLWIGFMFQMKRGAAANPYVLRSTQHMERVEQLLERMVTAIEKRDGKV